MLSHICHIEHIDYHYNSRSTTTHQGGSLRAELISAIRGLQNVLMMCSWRMQAHRAQMAERGMIRQQHTINKHTAEQHGQNNRQEK